MNAEAKLPEMVPRPREIRRGERLVILPGEVRLAAAGFPPARLAVMMEILSSAGVHLQDGADFSLEVGREGVPGEDVPAPVREEYYELELGGQGACIRAGGEPGALWGVRTLADLYQSAGAGGTLPALSVRDWPDLASRGIFVENKWGPDRMARKDWFLVVDRLAALKMNRMGVGLYGCWGNCRFESGPKGLGWPTEFLMVPVPGHPELATEKRLRWYSPGKGDYRREAYLPAMFAEDFLGEVVSYARERGVTVIPFVNSLGHNTMIPRLVPEIAARDEDGRPLGIGYCLSSEETRRFIEAFYGSVVERYFPDGADFFHVQMDEVWADHPDPEDPHRRVEPWCRCPECRARDREGLLQDYIVWLVEMLTRAGVGKVVMWNDQLTRHMDALDEGFVGKLEARGLADRLILHWWWYSNEALNEKTRVAIGKEFGLPGWVAPMTCYFNWQMYSPRLENIERMLTMARAEGGEGALSYAVHDPGWADHEMLLASYAWNFAATGKWEEQVRRWALRLFGDGATRYLEAAAALRRAAALPALGRCYHYTYTYCREGRPFPRAYPGEALEGLAGLEGASAQLEEAARTGREAASLFAGLAGGRQGDERAILASLQGEAARIEGLARVFAFLLATWEEARAGRVEQQAPERCSRARRSLRASMAVIEEGKPPWVVPATLQSLSVLLAFLDQLQGDLEETLGKHRSLEEIRWTAGEGR